MAFLKCIKNSRVIPNGKTVTPTDDVQIWLHCADIWDKSYTTVSEVLNDSTTTFVLMTNDNAVDYMIRSTTSFMYSICFDGYAMTFAGASDYTAYAMLNDATWCETVLSGAYANRVINVSVPTMTSNTAPSGQCYGSTAYSGYPQYYAFNNNSNGFVANVSQAMYIAYRFTRAVKVYYVKFKARRCSSVGWVYSVGTNNADYTDVCTGNGNSDTGGTYYAYSATISNPVAKDTHKIYVNANNSLPAVANLQFYGRENGGVQTWAKAAGIVSESINGLSYICQSSSTLLALMASTDACDYLVTAKAFIDEEFQVIDWSTGTYITCHGLCDNENFMTALGNSNYASNLLLSDADWYEAIKASAYASSVINVTVPKMTGDTTPSGEAYASSYASAYQPWKAFNQSTSYTTCWSWSGTGAVANNAWLAYDFGKAVKIYGVFWQNRTTTTATRPLGTLIVQGSNDKTTWTDVSDTLTGSATASATFNYHFANNNAYRHYRVLVTSTAVSGDTNLIIQQLQFYGREDVA